MVNLPKYCLTLLIMSMLTLLIVMSYYTLERVKYLSLLSDERRLESPVGHDQIIVSYQLREYASVNQTRNLDMACVVETSEKVDCMAGIPSDKSKCEARGCCWTPVSDGGSIPWCYYQKDDSVGYKIDNIFVTHAGYQVMGSRKDKSIWPADVMDIQMNVYFETQERARIQILDAKNDRYQVPIETPPINPSTRPAATDYKVNFPKDTFGIKLTRSDSGAVLFDTTGTKLTFADQYIEITTGLSTNYLYGLGERREKLLHDVSKGFSYSSWARDQPPPGCVDCNLYGQYPFFIGLEANSSKAYGVFLLNSNAMEITGVPATDTEPARLKYRTVGGILDFYVFTGPTLQLVVYQYLQVVGKPYLPPYWALGFHLCRWGYGNADNMTAVIKRMRDNSFPYDTQWNDIDYMNKHYDWTYDKDRFTTLPDIVKDLHDHGQHYIMIVDPGIANVTGYKPYDEGLKEGVFIMKADKDEPIIGKVWPGYTAFPDFFSNVTQKWWTNLALQYHDTIPYDGLWTDMNEPSSFVPGSTEGCTDSKYDNPPYTPGVVGGSLSDKTICPSARHHNGVHYNLHSLYGYSELRASQMALHEIRPGKRTLVISRSTFPGSGKYAGHWTGDNDSSWTDLKYSISAILNFQLFGIPFVGADICGFMGTTNGELCVRWTQLGVFYPFMRNHNTLGSPDQDPAAPMFKDDEKKAMASALQLRYRLIPHLYTLLARAHMNGTTVANPIWLMYPQADLYDNDRQLMWGKDIMVAPVLDQGMTSVKAYFPSRTWVDLATGDVITSSGEEITVEAPLSKIPVYIGSGGIIPMQAPEVTTTLSRKNPFSLFVVVDENEKAFGELYWDDGETLNATENGDFNMIYFEVENSRLTNIIELIGYTGAMNLDRVYLNNMQTPISSATVNGNSANVTKTNTHSYTIAFDPVSIKSAMTISW
ncbi:lysosomal alpha-glucosidase-like [Watersipora subatra]|uniref:lysosomal alpha-glucosidase-like n=1 Tax=Watersipora subatra TaxID=2589382 RepID=UPI00355BEDE3